MKKKISIAWGKFLRWLAGPLCLLGFAPEIYCMEKIYLPDHSNHAKNGLMLNLFFLAALYFNITVLFADMFYIQHDLVMNEPQLNLLDAATNVPFYLWALLWLAAILIAILMRPTLLPFVSRFFADKLISLITVTCGFLSQLLLVLIFSAVVHANSLMNQTGQPASVYMLYDNYLYTQDGIRQFPQWIFNLGMAPIAEQATARWGDGSVAVKPLSLENLQEALSKGRLIFLATHGGIQNGHISVPAVPYYEISPEIARDLGGAGDKLQFVYLAGCYTGYMADEWEQSLAPARVVSFRRISLQFEHVIWLWFSGPQIVAELE